MAGLGSTLTAYRSSLTTAGFTNLGESLNIDDLPATLTKVFRLSFVRAGTLGDTSGASSLVEYRATMRLEVAWIINADSEAIWNTVGTDMETLTLAMAKVSNRNAGTILVTSNGFDLTEDTPNSTIRGTATYELRYRIAQDMT